MRLSPGHIQKAADKYVRCIIKAFTQPFRFLYSYFDYIPSCLREVKEKNRGKRFIIVLSKWFETWLEVVGNLQKEAKVV